jgi:hypothetical protein
MAKLFITLVGNDLNVTQDTGGTTNLERYPRSAVKGVTPLKLNTKPAQGTIKYSAPSAAFTLGETITGGTSGATAVVSEFSGSVGFVLSSVVGTFTKGETITGGTSSSTATVVSATYNPTANEWSYPYNVMTVLQVDFLDGARLNIELQDVSNQNTWNTGNQAGLNAASAAFNTWLTA